MTFNQRVWYITGIIVLISVLAAALLYRFTGHLFLVIFIAPPLVHYFLRKFSDKNRP